MTDFQLILLIAAAGFSAAAFLQSVISASFATASIEDLRQEIRGLGARPPPQKMGADTSLADRLAEVSSIQFGVPMGPTPKKRRVSNPLRAEQIARREQLLRPPPAPSVTLPQPLPRRLHGRVGV